MKTRLVRVPTAIPTSVIQEAVQSFLNENSDIEEWGHADLTDRGFSLTHTGKRFGQPMRVYSHPDGREIRLVNGAAASYWEDLKSKANGYHGELARFLDRDTTAGKELQAKIDAWKADVIEHAGGEEFVYFRPDSTKIDAVPTAKHRLSHLGRLFGTFSFHAKSGRLF